ncbi:hypothetical protein A3F65_00120 [Candidatus Saccharibacteria bacterium RIFCSPHIGHO2_12_FULL_47_16b]|nr:MAG: hypothetical protein A3F65_00120 [Candidatus Saccharibacteria bacterium RIFCSPHIGHO2_12_FULL_47_16b]
MAERKRRAVITGVGTINGVGRTARETWDGFLKGEIGYNNHREWMEEELSAQALNDRFFQEWLIKLVAKHQPERLKEFEDSRFGFQMLNTHLAGRVIGYNGRQDPDYPFAELIPERVYLREVGRAGELLNRATAEALTQSGVVDENLQPIGIDRTRFGFVIGSGLGGAALLGKIQRGLDMNIRPGAGDMYKGQPDNPTVVAKRLYRAEGPLISLTQACASGGVAPAVAAMLIERGMADVLVAGGTEALNAQTIALFEATRAANTSDNPKNASRPYDVTAEGAILAEAAGVLVIEDEDHALRRGAQILAFIGGIGIAGGGAQGATEMDPNGVTRVMAAALEDGGITPEDRFSNNPHATSTSLGDRSERQGILNLVNGSQYQPEQLEWIWPTKGFTGHSVGAAGGVEAVASVMAIQEGEVPAASTTSKVLEGLEELVPKTTRKLESGRVLSTNMGFGDQDVAVLYEAYEVAA